MRRFFLGSDGLNLLTLSGDEFNHLKNVLRMNVGDEFIGFNGDNFDYHCKITGLSKNSATFEVLEKTENTANPTISITLIQALCKADKLEFITQKISEIGATALIPIYLKNCDVKQNTGKLARLEKIAISASKQCKRSTFLNISECITIKELPAILKQFDVTLLCNTREDNKNIQEVLGEYNGIKSVGVIVGPEGGFDSSEIETILKAGATSISLGKRILRTETAGLFVCSVLSDSLKV